MDIIFYGSIRSVVLFANVRWVLAPEGFSVRRKHGRNGTLPGPALEFGLCLDILL